MITVLLSMDDVTGARSELARRGLDFSARERWRRLWPIRALRRLGVGRAPFLPDPIKSWDLLRALEALSASCRPRDPILDLGCKDSALLACLAAMGFTDLTGIDLDSSVARQPRFGAIRWCVGDLYRTTFPDAAFAAITAMSTIEHGFDVKRLAAEVSRLLRPGGLFVFSTDYRSSKLDTSDVRHFGVEWTIFSRDDVADLLGAFGDQGLVPSGVISLEHEGTPIQWMGREYTFLFGELRKR